MTGDDYAVTFFKDSSDAKYSNFWRLTNTTNNEVLLDSSKVYDYGSEAISTMPTEGFIVKVSEEIPSVGEIEVESNTAWYNALNTKVSYMGTDLDAVVRLAGARGLNLLNSTYITADKLRRVELKFDEAAGGKAYRYLNGFAGNVFF